MQRHRQSLEEITQTLSRIEASWRDDFADHVIQAIESLPTKAEYSSRDLIALLDSNFEVGITVIRLILDLSKDEMALALRERLDQRGVTGYRRSQEIFLQTISELGTMESLAELAQKPVTWRDVLVERLKAGRGSAIKGQARGRSLESSIEEIVLRIFGTSYDARCRFVGARGTSTEKADFAIPSKDDPRILIEAKAYGATGSKQTDVLGDFARIIAEKGRIRSCCS